MDIILTSPKVINVYNSCNLGDQIINFIFFSKIITYIESNNIILHYYCLKQHHQNLQDFNYSKNIQIFEYQKNGYNLWQATVPLEHYIEDTLCTMFNNFLRTFNIPISVTAFEYEDTDLLVRFNSLEDKYKNINILIINSIPKSGQYNYDKTEWDNFIVKLSNKYTIATTEYVNNEIISLSDFSVKNIASIAINVKKIIAVNTGPSIPLYNTDILNNVDNVYIFGNSNNAYDFKTRKFTTYHNINDLSFLL